MMHNAWNSIEEVPYCFLKSSVKFQGHTEQKIIDFDQNWAFPDYNSSLNSPKFGFEIMDKALHSIEEMLYYFSRSSIKFQGHMGKKITYFDPSWA